MTIGIFQQTDEVAHEAVTGINNLTKKHAELVDRKLFQSWDLETICHTIHTGVAEEDFCEITFLVAILSGLGTWKCVLGDDGKCFCHWAYNGVLRQAE